MYYNHSNFVMNRIYSFDIFDTCVVRKCGTPANFFDILSKKIFCQEVDENERQDFIIARKTAEWNAYQENPKSNILDIYKHINYTHPALDSIDLIIKKEIELEKEVIVPVQSIKNKIQKLRAQGHSIIFISDMYLPQSILQTILIDVGIMDNKDSLFVSCDVGLTKHSGRLFEYIHNELHIPYRRWTHYGDNPIGDIKMPGQLGIHTTPINHTYSPYASSWNNRLFTQFNYGGIIAGLSRSIILSEPYYRRKSFITDLVAPLYCSFLCQIFEDAKSQGINRLYFCARDTYQLYQTAKVINVLYPDISIHYLFISRKSLKDGDKANRIAYFVQEGVASNKDKTAIVDTTSSGRTLYQINKELADNGYLQIKGYFLIKYDDQEITLPPSQYYTVLRQFYFIEHNKKSSLLTPNIVLIIENVFSSNNGCRTIDYQYDGNNVIPIFDKNLNEQDCKQDNLEEHQSYLTLLLQKFATNYVSFRLNDYSKEILHEIAIPTLTDFFYIPNPYYLDSLTDCYMMNHRHNRFLPYVKKESLLSIFINRGNDTIWPRASVLYSLSPWMRKIFIKCKLK